MGGLKIFAVVMMTARCGRVRYTPLSHLLQSDLLIGAKLMRSCAANARVSTLSNPTA